MIDLDEYFAPPVLDALERALQGDDDACRKAAKAVLYVCQDCAADGGRLLPLPICWRHQGRNGEVLFRIYQYGPLGRLSGRYEVILACPQPPLPFKAIHFGVRLAPKQRTRLLYDGLRSFWRQV